MARRERPRGRASRWLGQLRRDARELLRLARDPRERRLLLRGLVRGERMPARRRHALVVLVLAGAAALWALGGAVVRWAWPAAAPAWDAGWAFAGIGFLAAVAVPGTGTAALALLTDPATHLPSIVGSAAGAAAGALVVFQLGAAARTGLEQRRAHPWVGRFLDLTKRLARKGTYAAIAVIIGVPGLPRWVPIYAASVVGLRQGGFVAAVFAGSAVRAALVVWAATWFRGLL